MAEPPGWPIRSLFLAVTLITLFPLLVGEFVHSIVLARHDRRLAESLAQDASRAIASNVGRFVEDSRGHVATFARKPGLTGRGREPVDEILTEILEIEPRFAGAALIDGAGTTIATASRQGPYRGKLTASPDGLLSMLAAPTTYLSEPIHGRISGSLVCVITARVPPAPRSQAAFVGASVDLARLEPMLRVPLREYDAIVLILSREGRVVARVPESRAAVPGEDVSRTPIGSLLTTRKDGHAVALGPDGVRTLYGFTSIPSAGWIVAVGVPEQNVVAVVRSRLRDRLALLFAGLAGGLLVAMYASGLIAGPIGQLEAAAEAGASGKASAMPIAGPREIRKVGASLRRMTDSLRRNERASALGAVVAGLAHEIRGPLFALESLVDALAARIKDPGVAERYVPHLRHETRRLSRLATRLLDYGREQKLTQEPMPLNWVLSAAVEGTRETAIARGVELALTPVEGVVMVQVDRELGIDLFVNLIENAIVHSPAGSRVEVLGAAREGGVDVEILDRGPGIAAEDLPHLFEPFFSRRLGGTGIGLALVRRLVEDHGGTIMAHNREGGGARFMVRLPEAR